MKIVGLQKLTLLDFPGMVACTVFLGGCNFRCPFCHNSQLLAGDVAEMMSPEALLAFLKQRKGILDGVCFTGGEPTLHKDLPELLRLVKDMGYRVKLDTNGYNPSMLRALVEAGLVDYVAMDVKNSPDRYGQTVGLDRLRLDTLEESLRFLMRGEVDYELRTTVVLPLHDEASVEQMAGWLLRLNGGKPVKRLYLQPFVDRDTVPVAGLSTPSEALLDTFVRLARPCAELVEIRGA